MSALQIRAVVIDGKPRDEEVASLLLALAPWGASMDAIVETGGDEANGQERRATQFRTVQQQSAASERALRKQRVAERAAERIDLIIDLVAAEYKIERAVVTGASRASELIPVRAAVAWLARYVGGFSSTQVAFQMGPRDHSSILYNSSAAFELRDKDGAYRAFTDRLAVRVREIIR